MNFGRQAVRYKQRVFPTLFWSKPAQHKHQIQTFTQPAQPAAISSVGSIPSVNPSLLGGVTATPLAVPRPTPATWLPSAGLAAQDIVQPTAPVPHVAQPAEFVSAPAVQTPASMSEQPAIDTSTAQALNPVSADTTTVLSRDFNLPRPQTIMQEANTVSESAEAAYAIETAEAAPAQPAVPFDIATIEEQEKPKNRLRHKYNWRKWALGGTVVGLSLILGTGGLLFAQGFNNAHKVFRGTGASASLSAAKTLKLNGEDAGRVNFLLLGNGGLGHDAPDLTDTMIVASIDTVHKTAIMLSVPRDLWVQVPEAGNSKINAAYEIGKYNYAGKIDNTNKNTQAVEAGFTVADQVIKSTLGIDINYNVLVNFTSFKQAVDAVGGVTVNVPEILYDPTMAWENSNNPVLAQAGSQSMDGRKALMYVRSRETSSDFARSQRQRTVMLSLKSKVLSAGTLSNPLKVSGLVNAFGDNLVTDMSLAEGMRAHDLTKAIDNSQVQTIDLVTPPNNLLTTSSVGSASVAIPRAGMFAYGDIQKYVQQLLHPTKPTTTKATAAAPATVPENTQISVLNGTTTAGLASSQATTLKAANYAVSQVGNAPTKGYAKTVVVDLSNGANPNSRKYLESKYAVTAVTQLPDPAIQAGTANFVVILGSDQAH